jgi:hypothetical protein
MQYFLKNVLVTGLLSGCVLAFTHLIEVRNLGGLMSPIGGWVVPPLVGAIASIALAGPLWVRAIYCFFIFPVAFFAFRVFLMIPPKDAGSDAFLLAYTVGLAVYSTFGLLIVWFGAQYLSTKKEKQGGN